MGEGEDDILSLQQRLERFRLLEGERQRLVADHMDAGLDEGLRRRHMDIVWRDDGDNLDTVLALGFRFRHLAIVGIDTIGRQPQLGA